jgi:uncharacterized protein YndB with AHSA1/START domain
MESLREDDIMDRIEREITVKAPVERVWTVLTEPEHIAQWFGDGASGKAEPGGELVLGWKEHGDFPVTIERYEPPHAFSFRWVTGMESPSGTRPAPGNSTLVEFTLAAQGDGTVLKVVESGFESLDVPKEKQLKSAEGNIDGWRQELDELRVYAESMAG